MDVMKRIKLDEEKSKYKYIALTKLDILKMNLIRFIMNYLTLN